MKKRNLLLFLAAVAATGAVNGQSFDFEMGTEGWSVAKGRVSASSEVFKSGERSLCWQASAGSLLSAETGGVALTGSNALSFYVYSPEASDDILAVTLYSGKEAVRRAVVALNFRGWRAVYRAYPEFAQNGDATADKAVFSLETKAKSRILYLDAVNFDSPIDKEFIVGCHQLPDAGYIAQGKELLELYVNPIDISVTEVTPEEMEVLGVLAERNKLNFTKASDAQLERARQFVGELGLRRNTDGSVVGKPINTLSRLSNDHMTALVTPLAALASSPRDAEMCRTYIDYLLEQGIAEGVNFRMRYSDYTPVRTIPTAFFAAMKVADGRQKEELLKLVRWITEYGMVYYRPDQYLSQMNADILTNYIQYFYAYAAEQPSPELASREMKAFSRFMSRQTEYTKGDRGILKSDGTGFHHKSHYNNYMYAFRYWTDFAHRLSCTPYRITPDAHERAARMLVSMYVMAGRDKNDNRFAANSLSGRNPYYKAGAKTPVYKDEFRKLVEVGGDVKGTGIDRELASAFNYFFMTEEYDVPPIAFDGFFQFNYSPIGVYRTDDWVVTMRSPTTRFWGSEIYNKTNRLGRYQSHGTLEVIYNGGLTASGLPANEDSGGWDWNVVPGTTTIHYVRWREMMPAENDSQRFDQYALTKDFAGALSFGKDGMFAADFDQIDTWGRRHFEATNLCYKKSVFAFCGMLVVMGSNISADGNYGDDMITATNLFQEIRSKKSGQMIVNGVPVAEGEYNAVMDADRVNWIVTPMSTGYIIPAGNDPLRVIYAPQTTPKQTGEDVDAPKTTQFAAKAYLNHGVKTADKGCLFVVVPRADAATIGSLADNLDKAFEVKRCDAELHHLAFADGNGAESNGYAFFAPVDSLSGPVAGVSAPILLMTRRVNGETLQIALCDPDMHPRKDEEFGWTDSPSEVCVTLDGEWKAEEEDVRCEAAEGQTKLFVRLAEGAPRYVNLRK